MLGEQHLANVRTQLSEHLLGTHTTPTNACITGNLGDAQDLARLPARSLDLGEVNERYLGGLPDGKIVVDKRKPRGVSVEGRRLSFLLKFLRTQFLARMFRRLSLQIILDASEVVTKRGSRRVRMIYACECLYLSDTWDMITLTVQDIRRDREGKLDGNDIHHPLRVKHLHTMSVTLLPLRRIAMRTGIALLKSL